MKLDPHRFRDQPLLTRATAPDDYSVMIDGHITGRIMLRPKAFGHSLWLWTITGPALVLAGLASSDEARSLEEARLGFREAFDKWLGWALALDRPVHWFGGTT